MIANYQALLHDFSEQFGAEFHERYASHACTPCRGRRLICHQAIDRWLLDKSAYVSLQQAHPNDVNSPVEHGPPVERGYRPPLYGRALVVPVDPAGERDGGGLLDLKGAGVAPGAAPARSDYGSGLEYLGVALGDFFYGWLIDRIFARTVPGYCTVPVYAVIDLGFDIREGSFGAGPAGLHVRRAHAREERGLQLPMSGSDGERTRIQIELILRTFGLTTATSDGAYRVKRVDGVEKVHYRGAFLEPSNDGERARLREIAAAAGASRLEHLNIQLTKDVCWTPKSAQMLDFGHVHARRRFRYPLAFPARDAHFSVGRIMPLDHPAFVQPQGGLAVDGELFGRTTVNAFAFYVAGEFRAGRMGGRDIKMMLRRALRRAVVR